MIVKRGSASTVPPVDTGNESRKAAGVAGTPVTGFTCARCLTWFPGGTPHACLPAREIHPAPPWPGPEPT